MNWSVFRGVLFRLFGVVLEIWLKDLLERSGPQLDAFPRDTAAAITTWFAAARARTRWHEFRARRRLAILEAIVKAHSGEVAATLRFGGPLPVLRDAEARELAGSM